MKRKQTITTDAIIAAATIAAATGVSATVNNNVHADTVNTNEVTPTNTTDNSVPAASQAVIDAQSAVNDAQTSANQASQAVNSAAAVASDAQSQYETKSAAASSANADVQAALDLDHSVNSQAIASTQQAVAADSTAVQSAQDNLAYQTSDEAKTSADLQTATQANTQAQSALSTATDNANQAQTAVDSATNDVNTASQAVTDATNAVSDYKANNHVATPVYEVPDVKVADGFASAMNTITDGNHTSAQNNAATISTAIESAKLNNAKSTDHLFNWTDSQDNFVSNPADQQTKIDIQNLTDDQLNELTTYTANVINNIRQQIQAQPNGDKVSLGLVKVSPYANELGQKLIHEAYIDNGYSKKYGMRHNTDGLTKAANDNGLKTDYVADVLMSSMLRGASTMDEAKHSIYDTILTMMFGDYNDTDAGVGGHTSVLINFLRPNHVDYIKLSTGTYPIMTTKMTNAVTINPDANQYVMFGVDDQGIVHMTFVSDEQAANDVKAKLAKDAVTPTGNRLITPADGLTQAEYDAAIQKLNDKVTDAQSKLNTAQDALKQAQAKLNDASIAKANAKQVAKDAQNKFDQTDILHQTAVVGLKSAKEDLQKAQAKLAHDQETLKNMQDTQSLVDAKRTVAAKANVELAQAQINLKKAQSALADAKSNQDQANETLKSAQANLTKAQNHLATVKQVAQYQAQTEANDHGYHANGTDVIDNDGNTVSGWTVDPTDADQINQAKSDLDNAQSAQNQAQDAANQADNDVKSAQATVNNAEADLKQAQNDVQTAQTALDNAKNAQSTTASVTDPASYGLTVTATDAAKAAAAKLNAGTDWNSLTDNDRAAIVSGITISYNPTEAQKNSIITDKTNRTYGIGELMSEMTNAQVIDTNNFLAAGINGIRQALGLNTGSVYANSNMTDLTKAGSDYLATINYKNGAVVDTSSATKPYGAQYVAVEPLGGAAYMGLSAAATTDYKFTVGSENLANNIAMAHANYLLTNMLHQMLLADTTGQAQYLLNVLGLKYRKVVNGTSYVGMVPTAVNKNTNQPYVWIATPQSITDPAKFTSATTYGQATSGESQAVKDAQAQLANAQKAEQAAQIKVNDAKAALTTAQAAQTKANDTLTKANANMKATEANYAASYKHAKLVSPEGIIVTPGATADKPADPDQPTTPDQPANPSTGDGSTTTNPSNPDQPVTPDQPSDGSDTTPDQPATPDTPTDDQTAHHNNQGQTGDNTHSTTPSTPSDQTSGHDSQASDHASTNAADHTNSSNNGQSVTPTAPTVAPDSPKAPLSNLGYTTNSNGNSAITATGHNLMLNSNAVSVVTMKRSNLRNGRLPQTGNKNEAGLVSLGVVSLLGMFGIARRKRNN